MIERLSQPLVESGELSRVVDSALTDPGFTKLADQVIESDAAGRLVGRVIESPLLDEAVARLLESEDLWLLVDEIARSPAVTEAIGKQGMSFADQVAGSVRTRSRGADDRLELAVRGLVRRRKPKPEQDAMTDVHEPVGEETRRGARRRRARGRGARRQERGPPRRAGAGA